ncbi:MAG TPA: nitrite reductase small subunit NirD [Stellaceae bacterium]|jgi:nitrite reductase (NADH) small subunit|nr:nitrite reductase small subunit NirD [Stellaceae bacterium]
MDMNNSQDQALWIDIGEIADIPLLGSRVVATREGDIAVFRAADDAVFALHDRCPHKGGPLSQGIVHGRHVTCPLHGWIMGLEDGEAKAPDKGCAHRVAVRRVGDRLQLALGETPAAKD